MYIGKCANAIEIVFVFYKDFLYRFCEDFSYICESE